MEAARGTALEAIPGVEISTGYLGKEVHIVGLFLEQEKFAELTDFLGVINRRKEESNRALVAALRSAGYEISYGEIRERHPGSVNRAVIAGELLRKGYIREIKEAFCGVLSAKNGLYTPPERIPALEAVRFLRSINAVPVLAHPFISLSEGELRAFLPEAKEHGLAVRYLRSGSIGCCPRRRRGVSAVGKRRKRFSWREQTGYSSWQRNRGFGGSRWVCAKTAGVERKQDLKQKKEGGKHAL